MNKYANRLEKTKNKIEEIDKIIAENVAKKQRLEEQYEELCRLTLADALGCDPNNINTIIMSDPAILEKLRPSNDHKAEVSKKVSANVSNVSGDEDDDEIVFYDTITNKND